MGFQTNKLQYWVKQLEQFPVGWFWLYFCLYVGFQMYVLDLQPLPWYDETYMASIAKEFAETGKFTVRVAYDTLPYGYPEQQERIYGPVYFLIANVVFHLFGFSILSYRSIVFVSGLLVIAVFQKLLDMKKWRYGIIVLMSLDPFMNRSMHEGRMDLTALFFILLSIYCLVKVWNRIYKEKKLDNQWIIYSSLGGVFTGSALLTTPRTGFFCIPLFLVMLYACITQFKQFYKIALIWGLIVFSLYACWVYYAFGSISYLIDYYTGIVPYYTQIEIQTINIPKVQFVLISISLGWVIYAILKYGQRIMSDILFSFSLLCIISFYLLVYDTGPYAAYVAPFYYLLIFRVLHFSYVNRQVEK